MYQIHTINIKYKDKLKVDKSLSLFETLILNYLEKHS